MAQPIGCDNDDGNLATLLVTNIHNGDTFAICNGCIPLWAEAMLHEFAAVTPAAPEADVVEPVADDPEGAAPAAPFRVVESPEAEAQPPAGADDPEPAPEPEPAADDAS